MVRISRQAKIRNMSPRRRKAPAKKTGPLKDNLPVGYKPHVNAADGAMAKRLFIPKIK
ncbi:MAG: hypothetical protein HYX48_04635 [Chlamydiales bacterium]|nr:hypothetical protein [Chlamydiales bacterium]